MISEQPLVYYPGWQLAKLTLPTSTEPIQLSFVLCNYVKSQWDNAPTSGNYTIEIPASDDTVVYTLHHGHITRATGPKCVLVTDLDGTLLGDQSLLDAFNTFWVRNHMFRGSLLVYSTGRNLKDFLNVARELQLLKPDYAICGVGTEIYTFIHTKEPSSHISCESIQKWTSQYDVPAEHLDPIVQDKELQGPEWCPRRSRAILDRNWMNTMNAQFDRFICLKEVVEHIPDAIVNGNVYHDPFRLSVSLNSINYLSGTDSLENLTEAIANLSRKYNIHLSGSGQWKYLDVLPKSGGKRHSIEMICQSRQIPLNQVLVCGDSGNDIDMFTIPQVRGCCVANSQDDLVHFLKQDFSATYSAQNPVGARVAKIRNLKPTATVNFSKLPYAGGILDSIQKFGFADNCDTYITNALTGDTISNAH